jgi:hypothetical protein
MKTAIDVSTDGWNSEMQCYPWGVALEKVPSTSKPSIGTRMQFRNRKIPHRQFGTVWA